MPASDALGAGALAREGTPAQIAIDTATPVTPEPSFYDSDVKPMPPLTKAGVDLAKVVLGFIGFIAISLLGIIAYSEFVAPQPDTETIRKLVEQAGAQYLTNGSADTLDKVTTLINRLSNATARRASRDFWLSIGQFLLLNLLLPVLTSILGYIFGTMAASKD